MDLPLPSESGSLLMLLAPAGQLSGDGQLRELIQERRDRKGADVPLWFLSQQLVQHWALAPAGQEAIVTRDPRVMTWLQLRFGGTVQPLSLNEAQLREQATALPPPAPQAVLVR